MDNNGENGEVKPDNKDLLDSLLEQTIENFKTVICSQADMLASTLQTILSKKSSEQAKLLNRIKQLERTNKELRRQVSKKQASGQNGTDEKEESDWTFDNDACEQDDEEGSSDERKQIIHKRKHGEDSFINGMSVNRGKKSRTEQSPDSESIRTDASRISNEKKMSIWSKSMW